MSRNEKKVIHNIRTQVDSFGRKKYRLEQVIQSESQSEDNNQPNGVIDTGRHKSMLIAREEGLNIQKYIGKIQTNKKKKLTQVFYCDICSEGFKCDMAYITHINSPGHNRKLGMSMKVKNVSLESVSSKISALINKKLGKRQNEEEEDQLVKLMEGKNIGVNNRRVVSRKKEEIDGFDNEQQGEQNQQESVKEQDDEQVQAKEQQGQEANQQEQQEQQQQLDSNQLAEQEMMMQMGFGNKKHKR